MLEKLSAADFSPLKNQKFSIYFDATSAVKVALIEVSEKSTSSGDSGRQPFSIVFREQSDQAWPQGIYRIEHQKLGEIHLFLVPIGPDQDGMCYEAVFN